MSAPILWNEQTAAKATGGLAKGSWQATRVEIDSRKVQPGDLFVAIKGDVFDGHDFVKDALAKGAVAAVVSRTKLSALRAMWVSTFHSACVRILRASSAS